MQTDYGLFRRYLFRHEADKFFHFWDSQDRLRSACKRVNIPPESAFVLNEWEEGEFIHYSEVNPEDVCKDCLGPIYLFRPDDWQ